MAASLPADSQTGPIKIQGKEFQVERSSIDTLVAKSGVCTLFFRGTIVHPYRTFANLLASLP